MPKKAKGHPGLAALKGEILALFSGKHANDAIDANAVAGAVGKDGLSLLDVALTELVESGQIISIAEIGRPDKSGRLRMTAVYRRIDKGDASFKALRPMRSQVIPVRSGGRMAPDISVEGRLIVPTLRRQ